MLKQVLDSLNLKNGMTIVDATIGGAGHSIEIIKRILPDGRLIGLDQDEDAISASKLKLSEYEKNVTLIKTNFVNIIDALNSINIQKVDGILADIGVSSYQLDEASRGFSYMNNAPLDMRMDKDGTLTAEIIVNTYSKEELAAVIKNYGEEKFAWRIAQFIVDARKNKRIGTTFELSEIITNAIPAKYRRTGPHPAKRTFQALRIEVNKELDVLKKSIEDFLALLSPGGRLSIITFHSLEDRIVKGAFKTAENPCICPPDIPICVCGRKPIGKIINKKPIIPDNDEIENNPRSRSAKLRTIEKL